VSSLALLQQLYPGKVVLSVEEIARCLNLSRDHIYRLASADKLPFPLLKGLGDKIQVSVVALANYLDGPPVEPQKAEPAPSATPSTTTLKPKTGRPRGALTQRVAAFQSSLKVELLRVEWEDAFTELQEQVRNLSLVEGKASCEEKFTQAKRNISTFVEGSKIKLDRSYLELSIKPFPNKPHTHDKI
tara:strand:+ start:385 stop:945 length:561 start_codon:yes stop_codon:yes gene_type:complete